MITRVFCQPIRDIRFKANPVKQAAEVTKDMSRVYYTQNEVDLLLGEQMVAGLTACGLIGGGIAWINRRANQNKQQNPGSVKINWNSERKKI